MKLQGIFLPVTVPFDHNGELYAVKVQHNVEKWNRTGLSGYVVCGREGVYLSTEEKIRMWEWVAEYSVPEKVLIAATGMPSVRETVTLTNHAESLGYKAALVAAPDETPETRLLYIRAVADRAKIPVIITGITAKEALPEHPNIVAVVSDCPGPRNVPVLAGAGNGLAQSLAGGATGALLDIANAIPYAAISIWEAHRTRDTEAALDWQQRVAAADEIVRLKYGLAGLKTAMDLNGYYGGPPRLPLTVLTPDQKREIEQAFEGIKG
ncbi:MAG TPA: dihydrodipicolinate synthase family protein [Bryobacteraceae bacterium]|nr:dihydrodipicolinate synthase family protein [Bryobacteraceae bacterium]